ncbi:hypothetical protein J4E83_008206 [Alternaria metachromatica]|uniref:uncharacterized protein n=1 Tax=Alternaria metachromatica TaxID=283354 RepID=UPI0020C1CFD8|nr:uncharacterized protein J4E83_008206 [Alternaria metachromatica]KAI4610592.1 hypothetical protein J4E83_008206 [Alternaria metachromatica]
MVFLTLPDNRISGILDGINALVDNKDFKSLRLTCRRIYQRTHAYAAVRNDFKLFEIEIVFTHRSLCLLLHLAKIPEFRHKIRTIFFHWPLSMESSEAIYLLAECLRYLADARELFLMELNAEELHWLMFTAMDLAQFPQRCLLYRIEMRRLLDQDYGDFGQSPSSFARYMKWTSTEDKTPTVEWHRFVPVPEATEEDNDEADSGKEDSEQEEDSDEEMQSDDDEESEDEEMQSDDDEESEDEVEAFRHRKANEYRKAIREGYHVRDYRLNKPLVASFFHGMKSVPHLYIDGCDFFPRLRFCNACNDIFVHNIIMVPFTQLTTFQIGHMYVSGGRVQHFIKRHSNTLKNIEFFGTILTDGSWKTVAQVLRQISGLEHLRLLNDICQRAKAHPTKRRPKKYVRYDGWRTPLDTHAAVRRFLKDFIKYFSTSRYVYERVPLRPLPQYFKVDLFHLPSR